jgi:ribonuclease VapC
MANIPPSTAPSSPTAPANAREKKRLYVLDASALFALLQKEEGQARVAALIAEAQKDNQPLHLSLINWGEIYYTVEREQGAEVAKELIRDIEKLPIALTEVNRARVEAAVHVKSKYRVSYADAFAVALAQELGAIVVTSDPEFKSVEKIVPILWLREV